MVAKRLERVRFTHRSSTEGKRVRGGLLKMSQNWTITAPQQQQAQFRNAQTWSATYSWTVLARLLTNYCHHTCCYTCVCVCAHTGLLDVFESCWDMQLKKLRYSKKIIVQTHSSRTENVNGNNAGQGYGNETCLSKAENDLFPALPR